MRGIYERTKGSGQWWIRYAGSDGQIHREVAGTKSAAAKLYQLRKAAILEGRKLPAACKPSVTFKELADAALAYSQRRHDWRHDACRMAKVVEEFGAVPAEQVTPGALEAWLHRNGWRAGTRNRYRALVAGCYKRALSDKRISASPLVHLEWDSERDRRRIRFLTDAEEETLRGLIPPEYVPAFLFALNSGLRASELLGLYPEDVAADLSFVTLRHTKNGTVRHVRLNSTARAILEARRGQSGRIFPYRYNQVWEVFSAAVRAAGLNVGREPLDRITWHSLRHTFASRLVMAGVPIKTVSVLARAFQRRHDRTIQSPSATT